jgi:hypothetical protein
MRFWNPFYLLFVLLICSGSLSAQTYRLVDKNFEFQDGIYFSHAAFRTDQPDLSWEEVKVSLFANPQTFTAKLSYLELRSSGKRVQPDSIWGFSLNGIPYIRLEEGALPSELTTFAGIRVRGNICYFYFERADTVEMVMHAFNPANGLPFRTGTVEKEVVDRVERILRFRTGEMADFTVANFLEWIQDDPQLLASIKDLPLESQREKLYRCLLIYDDRNSVFIEGKEGVD